MRSWRAGSFTLGFMLIGLGISMTLSKVWGNFSFIDIIKWWPVAFIILGIEVLLSQFLSKDSQMQVRLDGGCIFLIGVLIVFTLGLSTADFIIENHLDGANITIDKRW